MKSNLIFGIVFLTSLSAVSARGEFSATPSFDTNPSLSNITNPNNVIYGSSSSSSGSHKRPVLELILRAYKFDGGFWGISKSKLTTFGQRVIHSSPSTELLPRALDWEIFRSLAKRLGKDKVERMYLDIADGRPLSQILTTYTPGDTETIKIAKEQESAIASTGSTLPAKSRLALTATRTEMYFFTEHDLVFTKSGRRWRDGVYEAQQAELRQMAGNNAHAGGGAVVAGSATH